MSFNTQHCLNFLEKKIDFELMARVIREINPDIVGLQEMRGQGKSPEYADQVKILSELSGMEHYYFAEAFRVNKKPYGNGLLSKIPLVSAQTVAIPNPTPRKYKGYYEPRCILMGGFNVIPENLLLNPIREK